MKEGKMRGIIDVGSNSVRLGVTDGVHTKYKALIGARLGEGLLQTGVISEVAANRGVQAVRVLKIRAEEEGVPVSGFATEAVRKAKNGREFVRRVAEETGVLLEVLSGEDEARIGFLGAVLGAQIAANQGENAEGFPAYGAVLDVGGASSELAYYTAEQNYRKSVAVGCVTLKNTCGEDVAALRDFSKRKVKEFDLKLPCDLYAIGGTATAIAAFDLGLKSYDPNAVTGHVVTLDALSLAADRLSRMTLEERVAAGITPNRADILLGGVVWMMEIMKKIGVSQFIASDRDNIEGYAILTAEREI